MLGLEDPLILLISGGHTSILGFSEGRWRVYGETLDITLGNLLDMFAREAGIPFPGGPKIEELASKGSRLIEMPYTIKGNNMVYSGLLTYAVSILNKYPLEDICYSLQETAFSILVEATERALVQLNKREIGITGGVASNTYLFNMVRKMADEHNVHVARLESKYNADNAVQIAIVGLLYKKTGHPPVGAEKAIVKQRYRIEEVEIPWRQ
jgi:glycoprotease/Kae1 family metallohydrolase